MASILLITALLKSRASKALFSFCNAPLAFGVVGPLADGARFSSVASELTNGEDVAVYNPAACSRFCTDGENSSPLAAVVLVAAAALLGATA